jgi:hypothetical protein
MDFLNLLSLIQANPRNLNAYRSIVKVLRQTNREHEAAAFENLIEVKFHGSDSSPADEEQRQDDRSDA